MKSFSWDSIPVTITDVTTTTSGAGGSTRKTYTVPTGKRWLLLGWSTKLDETRASYIMINRAASDSNNIETICNGNNLTANTLYCTRGLYPVANTRMWSPIELRATDAIEFEWNASAINKHEYTAIIYKEAPA